MAIPTGYGVWLGKRHNNADMFLNYFLRLAEFFHNQKLVDGRGKNKNWPGGMWKS